MFDRNTPFNDLPALPPQVEVETPAVLKKAISASRALAELKGMQREAPSIYSKDLIEQIFKQPYCKIAFLEKAGMGARQTCAKYLRELEKMGVLTGQKMGREVYFINHALFNLLIR